MNVDPLQSQLFSEPPLADAAALLLPMPPPKTPMLAAIAAAASSQAEPLTTGPGRICRPTTRAQDQRLLILSLLLTGTADHGPGPDL